MAPSPFIPRIQKLRLTSILVNCSRSEKEKEDESCGIRQRHKTFDIIFIIFVGLVSHFYSGSPIVLVSMNNFDSDDIDVKD